MKPPDPGDIMFVCNEKDIQTRMDSISSRFSEGRKLTINRMCPLAICEYSACFLIVATVQIPFGNPVLAGLPELAPSPGLSC